MNERIKELAEQNGFIHNWQPPGEQYDKLQALEKFAELIVKEMCGLLEQAEDDVYHCFEPSERPTEYIEWLRDWQERFEKHFGVEESLGWVCSKCGTDRTKAVCPLGNSAAIDGRCPMVLTTK